MSGFKKNDDTTTSKDKARKELEENISKRLDDIKDLIRKYDEGELNYDAEAVKLFPHLGFPANKKVVSKKNNTCAFEANELYCNRKTGAKVFVGCIMSASNLKALGEKNIRFVVDCRNASTYSTINENNKKFNSKITYYRFEVQNHRQLCYNFETKEFSNYYVSKGWYDKDGNVTKNFLKDICNATKKNDKKHSSENNIKIDDSLEATYMFFQQVFDFIDNALESGSNVLIHCAAGAHRAGVTSICYLMYKAKLDVRAAALSARMCRPIIELIGSFPRLAIRYEMALQEKLYKNNEEKHIITETTSKCGNDGKEKNMKKKTCLPSITFKNEVTKGTKRTEIKFQWCDKYEINTIGDTPTTTNLKVNQQIDKGDFTGPVEGSHYISKNICCGESPGRMTDHQLYELVTKSDINTFLCLQSDYTEYMCNDYREQLKHMMKVPPKNANKTTNYKFPPRQLKFLHAPMGDFSVMDDQSLLALIVEIEKYLEKNKNNVIYVHCYGGHGRTGTILTNLLMVMKGCTAKEALHILKEKHKFRRNCRGSECALNHGELEGKMQRMQTTRIELLLKRQHSWRNHL